MDLPPPPTVQIVQTIERDDLFNQNPISSWIFEVIDAVEGNSFDEKELNAIENHIPTNAGDLHLIFQFDGRWGNGGMQAIVLHQNTNYTFRFLQMVSDAFRRQNCDPGADYVDKLLKRTKEWVKRAASLEERDAPDEDWEALWEEIDAEDEVYDELTGEAPSPYETLAKKLAEDPESFIRTRNKD